MRLLSGAASPCTLVSLGLFLAEKRPAAKPEPAAMWLTLAKVVLQPAITWWVAARVLQLSPMLVGMAVLLVVLPTGTGPCMLAQYYARDAQLTARVILFSTVVALFTLSV